MKSLRWFGPALALPAALAVSALAAGPHGISARRNASAYAVHGRLNGVAIGVRLLTVKQVRARFVSNVSRCCFVVEVGVFPSSGKTVKVAPGDFTLSGANGHPSFTPESPQVVAYAVSKAEASRTKVSVYPSVGVGYGTGGGPWGYPGYPGGYPGPGGVYAQVGVGVGIGSAGEPSSADRATMRTELTDKSLPHGSFTKPVAGFLYFRVPFVKGPYELHYHSGQRTLTLRLR